MDANIRMTWRKAEHKHHTAGRTMHLDHVLLGEASDPRHFTLVRAMLATVADRDLDGA
jgi:hypothetical protein